MGGQARAYRRVVRAGGAGARVDDHVHGRQVLLAVTERFAGEALQAIALRGVSRGLHADSESEFVKKLQGGGMAIYDPTPAELDLWRKAAMPVWDKMAPQMDQALLARVQAIQK